MAGTLLVQNRSPSIKRGISYQPSVRSRRAAGSYTISHCEFSDANKRSSGGASQLYTTMWYTMSPKS